MGERVGWVADEGDDLFLDPDASFAAAQRVGRDTGDPLAIAPRTLHRRLQQAGLLRSVDEARGRLTVRRTLGDARRTVLHLGATVLEGAGRATPADDGREPDGPFAWDVHDDATSRNGPRRRPRDEPVPSVARPRMGRLGRLGRSLSRRAQPRASSMSMTPGWHRSATRAVQQPMDWTGVLDRSARDPDATDWGIIE